MPESSSPTMYHDHLGRPTTTGNHPHHLPPPPHHHGYPMMMKVEDLGAHSLYNNPGGSPYGHTTSAEMQQYYGQHVMAMPDGSGGGGGNAFADTAALYSAGLAGHPGYGLAGNSGQFSGGIINDMEAHPDDPRHSGAGSPGGLVLSHNSHQHLHPHLHHHQQQLHNAHHNNNCDSNSELIAALAETREIIS